jgi:hypothetical protein
MALDACNFTFALKSINGNFFYYDHIDGSVVFKAFSVGKTWK